MTPATIFVRFNQVGFHNWPWAVGVRAYLGWKHRHVFHVEVGMHVSHDDREVEFHDLRDDAAAMFRTLGDGRGDMGAMSCEMMARALGRQLADKHAREVEVTVWEDGEVGARVSLAP